MSLRAMLRRTTTVRVAHRTDAAERSLDNFEAQVCLPDFFRAKREDQREHRAVEGVPLRRDESFPRVQPSHRLRPPQQVHDFTAD